MIFVFKYDEKYVFENNKFGADIDNNKKCYLYRHNLIKKLPIKNVITNSNLKSINIRLIGPYVYEKTIDKTDDYRNYYDSRVIIKIIKLTTGKQ